MARRGPQSRGISSAGWIESKLGDWPLSTGGQIWRTGHSAEVANAGALEEDAYSWSNWPLIINGQVGSKHFFVAVKLVF